MKPAAFDYRAPQTLAEALSIAQECPGAKFIAGGQSLVPALNLRLAAPPLLIDLNRVSELQFVNWGADGSLECGALTRHRFFAEDPAVASRQPLLARAAHHIAHGAIRNRGSVGGSLCHSDPSAEWPAISLACGATMNICGPHGMRTVRAEEFFTGLFSTAVQEDEVLVSVRFPGWPTGRRVCFQEFSRRSGDFAIVGVGGHVEVNDQRQVTAVSLALFGASETAVKVQDAQEILGAASPQELPAAIARLAQHAADTTPTSADHHASAQYRTQLINVLMQRALHEAIFGSDANAVTSRRGGH